MAAAWQVAAKWPFLTAAAPPVPPVSSRLLQPGAGNKYDCFHLSFQLLAENTGNESKKLFLFLVNFAASSSGWLEEHFREQEMFPPTHIIMCHVMLQCRQSRYLCNLPFVIFVLVVRCVFLMCYAHQLFKLCPPIIT